jgi:hypothetical protein
MHHYASHASQVGRAHLGQALATGAACLRTAPPAVETDQAFIGMLDGYRSSGGLARAQEVFTLFKSRSSQDVITLAHAMALRAVLSFEWHANVWVPLFQFERQHMTLKAALEPVLAALNPVCTPWELAQWCAKPHRLLDGQSPADALEADTLRVLRVACADRSTLL